MNKELKKELQSLIKELKEEMKYAVRGEKLAVREFNYEEASHCRSVSQSLDYVIGRLKAL